jgi:hypothetical protein
MKRVKDIPAEHPHWSGHLRFSYDDDRVVHVETKATGAYRIKGQEITISWDLHGVERFFLREGRLRFERPGC